MATIAPGGANQGYTAKPKNHMNSRHYIFSTSHTCLVETNIKESKVVSRSGITQFDSTDPSVKCFCQRNWINNSNKQNKPTPSCDYLIVIFQLFHYKSKVRNMKETLQGKLWPNIHNLLPNCYYSAIKMLIISQLSLSYHHCNA